MTPVLFRVGYVPKQQAETSPQIVFTRDKHGNQSPFKPDCDYRVLVDPAKNLWALSRGNEVVRVPFSIHQLPKNYSADAEIVWGFRLSESVREYVDKYQVLAKTLGFGPVKEALVLFTPFLEVDRGEGPVRKALVGYALEVDSGG